MDLSFPLPNADDATPLTAFDLARVLADCGGLPVAGAPAVVGAGRPVEGEWLAPVGGAFSASMAARLIEWGQE